MAPKKTSKALQDELKELNKAIKQADGISKELNLKLVLDFCTQRLILTVIQVEARRPLGDQAEAEIQEIRTKLRVSDGEDVVEPHKNELVPQLFQDMVSTINQTKNNSVSLFGLVKFVSDNVSRPELFRRLIV